jgi:OFA family oxalate/formate antiporter-like MFS transporter
MAIFAGWRNKHAVARIIYAWSILKAPVAADFGWTASALALNFTITMCFFCIGGFVAGKT